MHVRLLRGGDLPRRLADLRRPPQALYLWGRLPPLPYVAIVGSRSATEEACNFVRGLARELGRAGVTVISGGAEGIDAAAHEGALEAGTPTLVVAPAGFGKPYPRGHADLFRRVVEQEGGYVSLVSASQGAHPASFFQRNAVLAGLCDALVLGEAKLRSGARNAVKHARRAGRAVFSSPAAPWNPQGRGSNLELRLGARWLEEAQDVLRYLEEAGQLLASARERSGLPTMADADTSPPRQLALGEGLLVGERPSEVEAVAAAIRAGHGHVDAICEATALGPGQVNVALLTLTLESQVHVDSYGLLRWKRVSG